MTERVRFGGFQLDPADRTLTRRGEALDLSARYFDALVLLTREQGRLVSKDRFLDEVWRGVPVTDEALTQCIRTLRRLLGDDAANPRFIETVPKHGYRFIAPLDPRTPIEADPRVAITSQRWRATLLLGAAGTIGAGVAGVAGGLIYGSIAASHMAGGGGSALIVLLWLTLAIALVGGAGVSLGIAIATRAANRLWIVAGGAAGGFLVGGLVKLLGLDAFTLLLGRSPGDITGAPEGLLLGAAVGLAVWLTAVPQRLPLKLLLAAAAGAAGGLLVALCGWRLLGGSLELLAGSFPESSLQLSLDPWMQFAASIVEGLLFALGIASAMLLARRDPAVR